MSSVFLASRVWKKVQTEKTNTNVDIFNLKYPEKSIGRDTFRSANRLEETFLEFFQNVFIFPPSPILSSLFCFVFVIQNDKNVATTPVCVTRCSNKKQLKIFQKRTKCSPSIFYLSLAVFQNSPNNCITFGLLLWNTLSPRTFKSRPIWSHCCEHRKKNNSFLCFLSAVFYVLSFDLLLARFIHTFSAVQRFPNQYVLTILQ